MSTLGPPGGTLGASGATLGDLEGGAPPPALPAGLTVTVYDAANAVEQTPGGLVASHDRRWQDRHSEPGGGGLTVQNTDAQASALQYGRVLRWAIDGTVRFATLVEEDEVTSVAGGEEDQQTTVVQGRGTMARWEDFVVWPEMGTEYPPGNDSRLFNFSSLYYSDAAWGNAVEGEQGTGDPGGPREGFPKNMPAQAEAAYWIWSEATNPAGSHPAGDAYFRRTYNSPGELVRIFITADNNHELYLDNQLVHVDSVYLAGGVGWGGLKSVDRWLAPGAHLFAVKATNVAGVDPNPSGFIMAAVPLLEQGTVLAEAAVLVTDSSWKALGYPPEPPGFTPRRVLEILLAEAQARGAVPELTLGASNTLDSDGTAWPITSDISLRVGVDGLSVLRQLAESYLECAMVPTSMRLDLWVKGGKGTASGVALVAGPGAGANLLAARHKGTKPEKTAMLDRWSGGYRQTTDAALVAAHGRREGFFSVGTAVSVDEVDRVVSKLIDQLGRPDEKIYVAVRPVGADVPYANYTTGDTVTCRNKAGNPVLWRVKGFTVTEDKEGVVGYVPELEMP